MFLFREHLSLLKFIHLSVINSKVVQKKLQMKKKHMLLSFSAWLRHNYLDKNPENVYVCVFPENLQALRLLYQKLYYGWKNILLFVDLLDAV